MRSILLLGFCGVRGLTVTGFRDALWFGLWGLGFRVEGLSRVPYTGMEPHAKAEV